MLADLRMADVSIVIVGARGLRPGFGDGDFLPSSGAEKGLGEAMLAAPCGSGEARLSSSKT